MKKICALAVLSLAMIISKPSYGVSTYGETVVVSVNLVSPSGVGIPIGEIALSDSPQGLQILPHLIQLPPGEHGMHIHENASCEAGLKENQSTAAFAAGSHFDPANTGKHLGPNGSGHVGDLPVLFVDSNGEAKIGTVAAHLRVSQIHGRSIVIHAGGDNYSDQPKPLGGGGARIACGVIP